MNSDLGLGAAIMLVVVAMVAGGFAYARSAAAKKITGPANWTETEWCIALEQAGRQLFDAKREYHVAYARVSELVMACPEHLRPILVHQLQLAQIHEKVIAKALAKDGLAVETLFGDPAIAAMPVQEDATQVASDDEPPSGEFDVFQMPQPKRASAWSRRRA